MSASSGEALPSINTVLPVPEFVNPKTMEDRICPICHDVLRQPMQTSCGHRLCETCLDELLEKNTSPRCPVDEEDCVTLSRKDGTVLPDFGGRKDLKKLEVFCNFKKYGCNETMPWAKLEEHINNCPYAMVDCSFRRYGCEDIIRKDDFKSHTEKCKFRPVQCQYCHETIANCKLQNHIDSECSHSTAECPHGCKKSGLRRSELKNHMETCRARPSACKFRHIGCDFMGNVSQVQEHETLFMQEHLKLQVQFTTKLETEKKELHERLQASEANGEELKAAIKQLTTENRKLKERVEHTEHNMKQVQKIVAGNTERTNKLEADIQALAKKDDVTAQNREVALLKNSYKDLETRLESLPSMESGYSSASGLSSDVSQHDRLLSLFNVRLAEVDLRLQMLETASYNGVLRWKIRGYNRRKADARSGKTISLYSQPFYTSPHGYKLCARVYLNGDGIGKGSHLSLFFVVMKGDYDALLPWPFRQKVTLMLLDQVGKHHLQDTFRPAPASSSFQKPQNEMNVASGCPLFVSHSVLEADGTPYIRDETIFIKVTVDTEGLEAS